MPPNDMKGIVESGGGQFLSQSDLKKYDSNGINEVYIISYEEAINSMDNKSFSNIRQLFGDAFRGVYTTEFVLLAGIDVYQCTYV